MQMWPEGVGVGGGEGDGDGDAHLAAAAFDALHRVPAPQAVALAPLAPHAHASALTLVPSELGHASSTLPLRQYSPALAKAVPQAHKVGWASAPAQRQCILAHGAHVPSRWM